LNVLSSIEEAKILAGGQSLITLMKLRLASPTALVDINGITELNYIREENGMMAIGALTHHDELAKNQQIREKFLLLSEAASVIADQQVRNRGTIGGSLAHADPSADLPTACTALGANIVTLSEKGSRSIQTTDFYSGYFTTSLKPDELIKEVRVAIPPLRTGGAYLKFTKGHNDFALVAVAAQVTVAPDDLCSAATVVLGSIAPTPIHAKETENLLINRKLNDNVIREGALKAGKGLEPNADFRASSEFRLKMAVTLTERALRLALSRALGGV
jgi:CO/xanthine dehydrogenase FAD-binding subunit